MKISPIPVYLVYHGFEKYLDADMVYERLIDSTELSGMYSHALIFL